MQTNTQAEPAFFYVLSSGALKRPFDGMTEETNPAATAAFSRLQKLLIQGIAPGFLP